MTTETVLKLACRFTLLLMLSVCLVIGCGKKGSKGERKFVTIGTAPGGGAFAQVGNAIANTLDANKGENKWTVTAQGTKGTQENIRMLESGDLEFGMANAAIAYFATRGDGAWEKPLDIRVVANMAPNVGIFVTTKSTGIKTIADLKGKRVVLGPSGAGFEYFLKPLLEVHGITYDDMEVINEDYLSAGELLGDGKVDAAFMGGAHPISSVTSLCATQDVVFLSFADGAAEKLQAKHPFYFPVKLSKEKYSDLTEDITGINVGNMMLVTHAKVDDETVYQVAKLLYENREKVVEQHPAGKALNSNNIGRDTGIPFHPGAIRYYKEAKIGPWAEADTDVSK